MGLTKQGYQKYVREGERRDLEYRKPQVSLRFTRGWITVSNSLAATPTTPVKTETIRGPTSQNFPEPPRTSTHLIHRLVSKGFKLANCFSVSSIENLTKLIKINCMIMKKRSNAQERYYWWRTFEFCEVCVTVSCVCTRECMCSLEARG